MTARFEVSLMGSMPRSSELLKAQRNINKGRMHWEDYQELLAYETQKVIEIQEQYDVDYITAGELNRDNYVSFIANALDGAVMMSNSQMLDYIEDKKAYDEMLRILDVPGSSIKNAICTGRLERKKPLVMDELKLLRRFTDCKVKICLPGPYLMTRSMWLKGVSDKHYASKEAVGEDVIRILLEEVRDLQSVGVDIIEFDEPVLTEVVFSPGHTRTFMCASLSEKKDPTEELAFAQDLIQRLFARIDREASRVGLHVCRGNWSKDESILLTGPYSPLVDLFQAVQADILYLEFSTDRAGSLDSLFKGNTLAETITLGLGVMNPRSDDTESVESIIARAEEALKYVPAERLMLNPDCGFATFAKKPVNSMEGIETKLATLQEAKEVLRRHHG